jgi:hypothetical protein
MGQARMGKRAKDIFAPSASVPTAKGAEARGPGRPKAHEEPTTKATVVLRNSQIIELDQLSTAIRAKSGGVVQRAQLIRAFVDAVLESGLDLSDVHDEEEVKTIVSTKLRARRS